MTMVNYLPGVCYFLYDSLLHGKLNGLANVPREGWILLFESLHLLFVLIRLLCEFHAKLVKTMLCLITDKIVVRENEFNRKHFDLAEAQLLHDELRVPQGLSAGEEH